MAPPRSVAGLPWWAVAIVPAAAIVAWLAAGALAQRTQGPPLPALADLAGVAAPMREAIVDADARARRSPTGATVGALARVYHASLRVSEALGLYPLAERLAPGDWTWTYLRALLLEERGDQAAARAALERVTTAAPGFGLAWYRLGELAFKQGRLDDAQVAYERARDAAGVPPFTAPFMPAGVASRQTVPLSAYAGLGLARVALDRHDRAGAATRLRALVDSYPAFGPARALLRTEERRASPGATAAAEPSPSDRAFDAPFVPPADPLLDAVVADSRHSDLLLKHAGIATRAGDPAWREFLVRRALTYNPQDLNVLMETAAMLQATGRAAEALPYLKQHEALAPGDHHTLVEEGRVLTDLGRLPEAEAVLRRAIVVRDAAAEYNLGAVLDLQDRWDDARAHYQRALAINPFHARAMNNLGVGLDRHGDSPAAVALFERAIDISPSSAEFYVNYGSALIQLRRFADAQRVLATGLALDPRAPNAHNNLGIALASLGDLPRARASFERALTLNPSHVNARRNMERVTAALASR